MPIRQNGDTSILGRLFFFHILFEYSLFKYCIVYTCLEVKDIHFRISIFSILKYTIKKSSSRIFNLRLGICLIHKSPFNFDICLPKLWIQMIRYLSTAMVFFLEKHNTQSFFFKKYIYLILMLCMYSKEITVTSYL